MDFLEIIYDIVFGSWLYGSDMADYLAGVSDVDGAIVRYPSLWLWAILVPLVVALLFYKIVDWPKSNRWWIWLLVGLFNSFLVGLGAYFSFTSELNAGNMPVDADGNSLISGADIFGVATAQFILGFCFFFIWSMVFKFISTNNCYVPFKFLQK